MNRNSEGGIDLTDPEAKALALTIIARWAREQDRVECVDWEDHPELSERSWMDVTSHVARQGERLEEMAFLEHPDIDAVWEASQ